LPVRRFRLEVELDPQPDERAVLQSWPQQPLLPDFIVVASGWIALEIGGKPVFYQDGRFVSNPAIPPGTDPLTLPQTHIGDYVALFLLRLLDATHTLARRELRLVQFADNPACLSLRQAGALVRVGYREQPGEADFLVTHVRLQNFRRTVYHATSGFITQLLDLNPALAVQPDVIALNEATSRL
jgi:hypothetical protein